MFEDFKEHMISTNGADLFLRTGGEGPPLLLLHGYPQTHFAWHKVAPRLMKKFSLVIPDLRGYGKSKGPAPDPDHHNYSKRTMALDAITLMQKLGYDRFALAGHDRGGRVAYRAALDHPQNISHLIVLDIIPTLSNWQRINHQTALNMFHWSFLAQQAPLPEKMITQNPDLWTLNLIHNWIGKNTELSPLAQQQYTQQFHNETVVSAACEDYRAGATCDLEHDQVDRENHHKIKAPTLVIWGQQYLKKRSSDILTIWQDWAENVQDISLDCGHFIAEEKPEECAKAITDFLD